MAADSQGVGCRTCDQQHAGKPPSISGTASAPSLRGRLSRIPGVAAERKSLRCRIMSPWHSPRSRTSRSPIPIGFLKSSGMAKGPWRSCATAKWNSGRAPAENITQEYPELKELAQAPNARKAIIDGEIVVLGRSGALGFHAHSAALRRLESFGARCSKMPGHLTMRSTFCIATATTCATSRLEAARNCCEACSLHRSAFAFPTTRSRRESSCTRWPSSRVSRESSRNGGTASIPGSARRFG